MKKIILYAISLPTLLIFPMVALAGQCPSNATPAQQIGNPACWTQSGSAGYWSTETKTCTWSCGHPLFICGSPQYFSITDVGNCGSYSSMCYDGCGNSDCENSGISGSHSVDVNTWHASTLVDTCHYIASYNYGACIGHSQAPSGANWTSEGGTSCANAIPISWCNAAPSVPIPDFPLNCDKNDSNCGPFKVKVDATSKASMDPDGDTIYYQIQWNNLVNSTLNIENFPGGEVASGSLPATNTLTHTWTTSGSSYAKVRACDHYNVCSTWSAAQTINVLECGNAVPANQSKCSSDSNNETGLISWKNPNSLLSSTTVKWILRDGCSESGIKCKLKCITPNPKKGGVGNYTYDGTTTPPSCKSCTPDGCEERTCAGATCTSNCDSSVQLQGIKDCRDENWQEVSPE